MRVNKCNSNLVHKSDIFPVFYQKTINQSQKICLDLVSKCNNSEIPTLAPFHNSPSRPFVFFYFLMIILCFSCKKLVEIPEPVNTITTSETFKSEANATAALIAIYQNMITRQDPGFASGGTTIYAGLSADELNYLQQNVTVLEFQNNTLLPNNSYSKGSIWDMAYFNIYQANAAIEGLNNSSLIALEKKNQLLGEAKFLRAFCYFYLLNFFGDVPSVMSTDWESAQKLSRTSKEQVYEQIVKDLKEAESLLPDVYFAPASERVRVNKWVAIAMLARVYLYTNNWANAEAAASTLISNSTLFGLENDLNSVFLKNSKESIWQLQIDNDSYPYGTYEGLFFLPEYFARNYPPNVVNNLPLYFIPKYYFTTRLINAFENNDKRKLKWVDSTGEILGTNYYYPYKYKIRIGTSGNVTEYYTVLRLAEQYLIRAEARAHLDRIGEARADLNVIRLRAGLADTSVDDKSALLDAILKERQVELFAEWGHRWFDLKRTGNADAVLSSIKGSNWQTTDQLYPIPISELTVNPKLTQNGGY